MTDGQPVQRLGTRKSLKRTNIITIILLIVFILIAYGIELGIKPSFSSIGLLITGYVMAFIPALLWLGFFYRQDQQEPEPKGMVLLVAFIGALVAGSIGIPFLEKIFNVSSWIYDSVWITILGGILVIGFSQEFLKFITLRLSIYNSNEFDEREDGIIYGTAVGVGFATAINISFIINTGGALLGTAATRMVLTTLAQASFAGISGYFLGKEKIDGKPFWWMPCGVVLAAILNGVFFFLYGELTHPPITVHGGGINPWAGLVLAIVVAVITAFVLSWLIERDDKRQLAA